MSDCFFRSRGVDRCVKTYHNPSLERYFEFESNDCNNFDHTRSFIATVNPIRKRIASSGSTNSHRLYGKSSSCSRSICSLSLHRFSPNSTSCACFEGSVTLRSGTICRCCSKHRHFIEGIAKNQRIAPEFCSGRYHRLWLQRARICILHQSDPS